MTGRYVYINNKKYPIVGRIAMDNLSVSIDETVKIGDKVEIIRDFEHAKTFIDDPNDIANVIAMITNLSVTRVPRVPVDEFNEENIKL
ncbi:hypothetical protein FACS189459_1820 [Bacilli bacterium]|nr:hypothetical protein FACS189459_1820 [Bacilli bacterium]